jgi:peptidoglycan hydrolase-like protein with peptidoglycan-binding domain
MAIHIGRRQFIVTLGGVAVAWPLAACVTARSLQMKKLGIAIIWAVLLTAVTAPPLPSQFTKYTQVKSSTAQARDLDMDAVPNLTQEDIRVVQQALEKKGFSPGPIDGVIGRQTEEAVHKFQDFYGIKPTGHIDNQTLYALGAPQLASQSRP